MSFRPQFAYVTPAGSADEQFHYSFDGSNTPALNGSIPSLGTVDNIPLLLQADTEFHWRGIKVGASGGSSLNIRFQDPYGNFLSDGYVPALAYSAAYNATLLISQGVVLESAIVCPPAGVVWLYIQNPTAAPYSIDFAVSLLGVKRTRNGGRCSQ